MALSWEACGVRGAESKTLFVVLGTGGGRPAGLTRDDEIESVQEGGGNSATLGQAGP